MKLRYVGPDATRDLPLPGGCIVFTRNRWVDLGVACDAARIPRHHAHIVAGALAVHPHWEVDHRPTRKPKEPQP